MAAVHFTAAILGPRTTVYGLKLEELLHSHICEHQTSIFPHKWVNVMGDWNRNIATFLSTLMAIPANTFYNEQHILVYWCSIMPMRIFYNYELPSTVGWHVGPQ